MRAGTGQDDMTALGWLQGGVAVLFFTLKGAHTAPLTRPAITWAVRVMWVRQRWSSSGASVREVFSCPNSSAVPPKGRKRGS